MSSLVVCVHTLTSNTILVFCMHACTHPSPAHTVYDRHITSRGVQDRGKRILSVLNHRRSPTASLRFHLSASSESIFSRTADPPIPTSYPTDRLDLGACSNPGGPSRSGSPYQGPGLRHFENIPHTPPSSTVEATARFRSAKGGSRPVISNESVTRHDVERGPTLIQDRTLPI